jgi:hypothetical protein
MVGGTAWRLVIDERFAGPDVDPSVWLPYYLPHWSSRERAAARYSVGEDGLTLRIDPDQEPWNPEMDPGVRVSSLQTGVFAGPLGSSIGQHHFRADLRVHEEQAPAPLFTPTYGRFEVRLAANGDADMLMTLWMIGFEDELERSGEICVVEAFGRDAGDRESAVRMGIHPFGDPALHEEFEAIRVPIDTRVAHDYAVEWLPAGVSWFVDGAVVKRSSQSPGYPMQFMLGLYELPIRPPRERARTSRSALVKRFRAWASNGDVVG